MVRRNVIAALVIGLLALPGCQANGSKEAGGTILGAAGGGLLGSQVGSRSGQVLGIAIGTLAGAMMGADIGRSLDNADRAMAQWNQELAGTTASTTAGTRRIGRQETGPNMIGERENGGGDCTAARRSAVHEYDEAAGWPRCERERGARPVVD